MVLEPLDCVVLDRHPDGVLRFRAADSAQGAVQRCSYANRAALTLLGSSAPLGLTLSAALAPVGGDALLADLRHTLQTGEPCRRELLTPSGHSTVEITALRDGDGLLLYVAPRPSPPVRCTPALGAERLLAAERFGQLLQHCPVAAFIKDAEGRYVWLNAALEKAHARPAAQWLGRTDAELGHRSDAAGLHDHERDILSSGVTSCRTDSVTIDGRREHYLSYTFRLVDGDGTPPMLAGMSVPITEHIEAQEKIQQLNTDLQATAGELQSVLDLVPIAIYLAHDPECRRITGNVAAANLLSSATGANLSLTAQPDQGPRRHKVLHDGQELAPSDLPIQRAARGMVVHGEEYDVVFEDGRRKHIFGYASPLYDANRGVRGSLAAFLDITERKLVEASLQRRTRQLQLLWESARVLMTVEDPDALVRELFAKLSPELGLDVYFNYAVQPHNMLRLVSSAGLSADLVEDFSSIAFGAGVCGRVAQESKPIIVGNIQQSSEPTLAMLRATGIGAYVSNPLRAGDRLIGTLSFGSRRRPEFENDDVEFLQTITQYVAVAYERLRLIEQLRDADRRKDDFLATLAHELRNPLAPIRNAVQILKARGPADPKLAWSRDVIDRQVRHMARLLEDLLDVSRISRDKLELRRERVELSAVIEVAVETSRPVIDASHHELSVHVPPGPLGVDADPVRLAQVFSNLLNNAAKYTPHGGKIAVNVELGVGQVQVTVRDNGIGIEREMLPRVFEIFSQAAPALDRAQGGLGIGLSLVKGLVQLHGGTVSAFSAGPGRGSEFVVVLPVADVASHEAAPEEATTLDGMRRRVLVVDDNEDSADTLAALLEMMGSEVVTAYAGEQALAIAETFRPAVILLDIGMPGMNGFAVCRRIRAQPWGHQVFMVAMTGWGQEGDRRQTREAGFDHHLVKPADTADLAKLITERPSKPGV